MTQFNAAAVEGTSYYDDLFKLFKKKAKRSKKAAGGAAGGDRAVGEDGEEGGEDEEENEDFDEESDLGDEEEEDHRPEGCSDATYQTILQLRERRMDQEEQLLDFQKGVESLRKENDSLLTKERSVDSSLRSVEAEIQTFQNEKQRKLNEIHMIVPLKFHQFENLDSKGVRLEPDLTRSVVFTNSGLRGLSSRIQELIQEKADLRRHQKELKKQSALLVRSRSEKDEGLQSLSAKKYEVMLLKFGQVFDLDSVDNTAADRKAEELFNATLAEEKRVTSALSRMDRELLEVKESSGSALTAQTALLERFRALQVESSELEDALNRSQKSSLQLAKGETNVLAEEQLQLKDIAIAQAREADALKAEISILRKKGGHVYAPIGV